MYAGAERRVRETSAIATAATVAGIAAAGIVCAFAGLVLTHRIMPSLALAASGVLVAGTLASAEFGIYAVLAIAFFDGLLKGISPGWHTILAKDVLLALTIIRWLWDAAVGRHQLASFRSPVAAPAFLFIVYCGAQMFNTTTASLTVALAGFRAWILWIPFFFIAYDTFRRPHQVRRFIMVIALLTLLTSLYGVVQYRIGFEHLTKLGPGFDFYHRFAGGEHVRATSTLVNPGVFGAAAALSALVCLGGIGFVQRPQWLRTFLAVIASVSIIGMAASGSRAPLLSLLMAIVAFLVLIRRRQFLVVMVVVGLVIVGLVGELAPDVFQQRYTAEKLNLQTIIRRVSIPLAHSLYQVARYPLGTGVATGIGVGRVNRLMPGPLAIEPTAAGMIENDYGRALRELGFPGAFLYVFMLYRILMVAAASYSSLVFLRYRWMAGGLIGVLVAVLGLLTVGTALYLAPSGPLFYLAAGICARLPVMQHAPLAALEQGGWRPVTRRVLAPFRLQPSGSSKPPGAA